MTGTGQDFPDDKTAPERRKDLTDRELKELKLAGGVEGGMEAGSGGPEPREEGEEGRDERSANGDTPAD